MLDLLCSCRRIMATVLLLLRQLHVRRGDYLFAVVQCLWSVGSCTGLNAVLWLLVMQVDLLRGRHFVQLLQDCDLIGRSDERRNRMSEVKLLSSWAISTVVLA